MRRYQVLFRLEKTGKASEVKVDYMVQFRPVYSMRISLQAHVFHIPAQWHEKGAPWSPQFEMIFVTFCIVDTTQIMTPAAMMGI